jgi:hypothetical protein
VILTQAEPVAALAQQEGKARGARGDRQGSRRQDPRPGEDRDHQDLRRAQGEDPARSGLAHRAAGARAQARGHALPGAGRQEPRRSRNGGARRQVARPAGLRREDRAERAARDRRLEPVVGPHAARIGVAGGARARGSHARRARSETGGSGGLVPAS